MNPLYHMARFLKSVYELEALPPDTGAEVAFAGRSNSGKSSALNAVTGVRGLARTSKIPGRTQAINVFALPGGLRLIDLPGYGYAKVPREVQAHWAELLPRYLATRRALAGVIITADARHPLTEHDRQMLAWCADRGRPVHVLLTKADKLKRGRARAALEALRRAAAKIHPQATGQLFSAPARQGVDEVHAVLDHWLGLSRAEGEA